MKKVDTASDLRPEYEFAKMKGGVRGEYAGRYRAGTNIASAAVCPPRAIFLSKSQSRGRRTAITTEW